MTDIVEELRAALKPFAEYPWDIQGIPDDAPLLPVCPDLRVGHVWKAREALGGFEQQPESK